MPREICSCNQPSNANSGEREERVQRRRLRCKGEQLLGVRSSLVCVPVLECSVGGDGTWIGAEMGLERRESCACAVMGEHVWKIRFGGWKRNSAEFHVFIMGNKLHTAESAQFHSEMKLRRVHQELKP